MFTSLIAQMNAYVAKHQGAAQPLFALHTGDIVPSGQRSALLADALDRSHAGAVVFRNKRGQDKAGGAE